MHYLYPKKSSFNNNLLVLTIKLKPFTLIKLNQTRDRKLTWAPDVLYLKQKLRKFMFALLLHNNVSKVKR